MLLILPFENIRAILLTVEFWDNQRYFIIYLRELKSFIIPPPKDNVYFLLVFVSMHIFKAKIES